MKVDTMRFIDKYAGIPLCFFGTVIRKIFIRRKKHGGWTKPKRILFIELSEMGSAILADPAMEKAKKVFGAELYFLIFKKNKPSLDLLKTVPEENIFTIDADGMGSLIADTFKFFIWARKNHIDTVIDLELFSRYSGLLAGFCGADNIAAFNNFHGEGLYKGGMVTHKIQYSPHHHIAKNFIAMVNALAADKNETPYSKQKISDSEIILKKAVIDESKRNSVAEKIKKVFNDYKTGDKLILINPNASELLPQRRWSMKKYGELIGRLLDKYDDAKILITGAPSEKNEALKLEALGGNPCRCKSFAGMLKLDELTALYDLSLIMVSNDSGPAHFASVTDMPTVVIFGPETPALYKSLGKTRPVYAALACSPCVSAANHRKTPCSDNVCLQVIEVDEVAQAVEEMISG